MLDWTYEQQWYDRGYRTICGCDEAGRGPLAGPVVAAAVILPRGIIVDGLNDSKQLTPKRRERLYDIICTTAVSYGIAWCDAAQIDAINILNAALLAMKQATQQLSPTPDFALIDGNCSRYFDIDTATVIKGDALVPSIAAASILAKVTRDNICLEMDAQYPQYHFAKHKGYATKEHKTLLLQYGACPLHRKTFLKFMKDTNDSDMRTSNQRNSLETM